MNKLKREVTSKYGIMGLPKQHINQKRKLLPVNIITQEAKKSQAVVKYAMKKGKSIAGRQYGVSLSSVKGGVQDTMEHGNH